ncbi:MAG: helix-turn-helix transcriptional regulator [Spirochaetales bacterium]|nr:helix-turn-helix transcriptional regulator [Spirochaetales bacterium]
MRTNREKYYAWEQFWRDMGYRLDRVKSASLLEAGTGPTLLLPDVRDRIDPGGDLTCLSSREKEVYFHMLRGRMYREIAAALNISTRTVEKHVQNISRKLRIHTKKKIIARNPDGS